MIYPLDNEFLLNLTEYFTTWKKGAKDVKYNIKLRIYIAMGVIIGVIITILIIALIGEVLMQDSLSGLLVIKNFWQDVLSLTGY